MVKRLAAGRHHLTRDQVEADQRRRLFQALAVVMADKGYNKTAVADLIEYAKVSRATFYEHFDSKQDCFMAAYARLQNYVVTVVTSEPEGATPMLRFSGLLKNYLATIAAEPATARLYLVEVHAAGPEAMRARLQLQQELVAGVATVFGARSKADRFACLSLVATISTLVTNALVEGDADTVLALHKPLMNVAERLMTKSPAAKR